MYERGAQTPDEHRRVEAARDNEILNLLLSSPYSWAMDEVLRELHDQSARDGLARLAEAGLIRASH
jgi:hypothetical protein